MHEMAAWCGIAALTLTTACGARLVADDVTPLAEDHGTIVANDVISPPPVDTGLPIDVPSSGGGTFMFVFDSLTIDMTDSPDIPHTGFDLDSLYSQDTDTGGCTHPDYYSLYDNDQHCLTRTETCAATPNPGCVRTDLGCRGGVDNMLPTLANTIQTATSTDARSGIQTAVSTNRFSLLVRLTGVDDRINDASVRVSLYRAYPVFTTGCSAVAPGREYAIAASSLTPGATDIDAGALITGNGRIVNGRLQFDASAPDAAFLIPMLWFSGAQASVPLRHIRFRANLAPDSLTNGSLGGMARGDDVIAAVAMAAPDYINVIRGVIGGLVDVQVMGVCDDSGHVPPQFGAVSFGYGVHAVPAQLSNATPIVSGPAPGTCGAM